MADSEEAERDQRSLRQSQSAIQLLSARLEELTAGLRQSDESEREEETTAQFCRAFCQTLVECVSVGRTEEEPWAVLESYRVALLSFVRASTHLSVLSENVRAVLERLSLSCVELLLSVNDSIPDALWEEFQSSVQTVHAALQQTGVSQLRLLSAATRERGMWSNSTLQSILRNEVPPEGRVREFLEREGPELLQLRVKRLIKENCMDKAALLAKACAEFPQFEGTGAHFKQSYLVCLCSFAPQDMLMDELSKVDCRDALEMICNLEADGDERGAFTLCSGFLSRQLLQEDSYCAWELTLFWSKLLKRLEPSEQGFLEKCQKMSLLAKTVFHLLFFIKVIQSELDKTGLPACVEMCIRALRMESCEGANKATVCKTISCLMSYDLEVKRACQLTEFLLEPTVDSYYAVETLYNEPDQKLEEENLPIPNSLRCELLLVFKTQWPFDPEFWDWKTLKRHCLGLMGEEASIVSSIDELNDDRFVDSSDLVQEEFKDVFDCFLDTTHELNEIADQKQKNREVKKLREKGFVSARFRNWQAYMQYCVLCDKEFLGHRIVRHAQTHFKDGCFTCPICTETFETRETLDPHVASHVKLACKERLAAMKTTKQLANANTPAPVLASLKTKSGESPAKTKAKSCERVFNGGAPGSGVRCNEREGNVCPVPNCRKGFKYYRNLIAHVKDHGNVEEAKRFLEIQNTKIVCQYCRRHFVNVNHLNDHLQVHCGAKPYTCIQLHCKASFDTNAELLVHSKGHPVFKAKCMFPGCGKIFSGAFKLYDHEAQHYKTFTCKVPGCGKVFHAQSQLDLHEESHNTKQEPQTTKSDITHDLGPRPDHCGQPAPEIQPDIHQTSPLDNCMPTNDPLGLLKVKHTIKRMINPSCTQAYNPGTFKEEPSDPNLTQIPCVNNHLLQPPVNAPMPHLSEPRAEESLLDALMNDSMLAPPGPVPAPSYQSILEDLQPVPSGEVLQAQMQTAVSQSHTQPLYSNENAEYGPYDPNPIAQMQAPYQIPYLPLSQPTHNGLSAMPVSQRLPPQVPTFPSNRPLPENRPVQPIQPVPPNTADSSEEKERYRCAYETCSRDYSNYRSLTKHMKAAHCEFYTQWKLSKRNNRVPPVASRHFSMNEKPNSAAPLQMQIPRYPASATPMQTPAGPSHYPGCPNSNSTYPPMSSRMESPVGQTFPSQIENILDPIVLSQMKNTTNQSPVAPHSSWNTVPINSSLQQQTYCSQVMTLNMDVIPSNHISSSQMDTASPVQGPKTNHGGMTYPSLQHPNNPPCHFIPSQTDTPQINPPIKVRHQNDSPASPYIQPKTNTVPVVRHTDCVVKLERDPNLGLGLPPPQRSKSPPEANAQPSKEDDGATQDGGVRKRKRSNRTKWPAIIRDGKFICCRCFREFQSPKSLGGHLSKRAICKPYDETVLSADLPVSFLELLNSPHPSNTPQSSPSAQTDSGQIWPSVNKGPLDPKLFPNVTFLHTNESAYASNSKESGENLKPNSAKLHESVGAGQQTFADSSVSYLQDGQSSVIQHTANVKLEKTEPVIYTPSCKTLIVDSGSSEPLLSRLLDEDRSPDSFNKLPADHVGRILQAKTLNKMKEIKEESTITNTSGLSNDGLLAAMASLAQNLVSEKSVKEKLREQILGGDFQKRITPLPGACSSNSQSSAASSPTMSVTQATAHIIQKSPQTNELPLRNGSDLPTKNFEHTRNFASDESQTQHVASKDNGTCDQINKAPLQKEDAIEKLEKAFERMDLDREVTEDKQSVPDPPENEEQRAESGVPKTHDFFPGARGYCCDSDGCGYRAMTKDALFKHLIKQHNYTEDMLNQFRKEQFNFAPFTCQLCPKTFTRNSNLRTHYQTSHNYSLEQIVKMGITRHYNRKTFEGDRSPCPAESQVLKASSKQPTGVPGVNNVPVKQQLPVFLGSGILETMQKELPKSQVDIKPSVIKPVPSMVHTSQHVGQHGPNGFVPRPLGTSQPSYGMPSEKLPKVAPHIETQSVAIPMGSLSPDKKPKLGRPKLAKTKEMFKKSKDKKSDIEDAFSPYRPYRCVHQGCVAAFTIQHNLILHYKAVHQSALPKFEVNDDEEQIEEEKNDTEDEQETGDGEDTADTEFLCQVKDCSRIFQTVTDLLQHYIQLHRLSLDKAGAMISGLNLGRFQCDQSNCAVAFTTIWKYISHVNSNHKEKKVTKIDAVDGVYQCVVEGCTLGYSTRSNLLRHIMRKHQELYKLQVMNARRSANGVRLGRPRKDDVCLEKENREVNKKHVQKASEKKKKEQKNHWTKYGKPILKTKEEASAMCTKKIQLQYPCMIKGCETVTGSERHLMKHYVQHGLPKQDLEEQRSNYIFCKKMPRSKYKRIASRSDDTDKSGESSIEVSENEEVVDTGPSESEFSKPTSEKESTEETEVSDAKLSTDVSSETSVVVKRKKGRPRKGERVRDKPLIRNRMTRLRAAQSYSVNYADLNSDSTSSSVTLPQEQGTEQKVALTTFKPMGFEVSFLKFLEESSKCPEKRKASETLDSVPRKKLPTVQLKTATVVCSRINPDRHASDAMKLVEFKNPQNLTSLRKITFEVHRGLSNVFELLLKQLHDMRPAVVIQKEGTVAVKG